jgi:hypothetical protein
VDAICMLVEGKIVEASGLLSNPATLINYYDYDNFRET